MKKKSLMYKSLTQFIVCVAILLLLATPLFYWLTKSFYAEDMIDIIEAVQQGKPVPALDLEEDILHGIMIQFALIVTVLGVAIVLMMRFISGRLWQPFDKTLEAIEHFKLENGVCPQLAESNTKEFARLNTALQRLMTNSLNSYRLQKEFTENASHELQNAIGCIPKQARPVTATTGADRTASRHHTGFIPNEQPPVAVEPKPASAGQNGKQPV